MMKVDAPKHCTVGSGSIKGNKRCTGWVVLCPSHPKISGYVFKNKVAARRAQHEHLRDEHQSGDVIGA